MDSTNADALSLIVFGLTLAGGIAFMAFRSIRATAREAAEKSELLKEGVAAE
jgi:hypothetical protein